MSKHEVNMPGYKLTARIGEGGMGVVFKGVQLSLNRSVAVKVLSPNLAKDKMFVERFLREAKAAGQLNHRNIARTYDAGEVGGINYMVMELIEGGTVSDMLESSGRLPIEEACELAAQVADGLAYVHSLGIVHRDIKPSNVMLSAEGAAKIMDMGLAKQLTKESKEGITLTGQLMGSPQYMSPEQIRSAKDVDYRTDIFSLGATLYHMVVGRAPFEGESIGEIMVKAATEAVRFPRDAADELPAPLKRLVKRMMSKNPRRRPSAQEVADQLREMLETGFREQRAGAGEHRLVRTRASRSFLPLVGVAAIVIAAVVVLVLVLPNGGETNRGRTASPEDYTRVPKPEPTREPEPAPAPVVREPGYYAFQDAMKYSQDHPTEYAKRLKEFRRVASEYPVFKEKAQAEAEKVIAEVNELYKEEAKKAGALEGEGRLFGAISVLRSFAKLFKEFEPGKAAAEDAGALEEKMKQRFGADVENANTLVAQGKHKDALAVLAQVKNYGSPDMSKQAEQLAKSISRRATSEAARKALEAEARKVFEEASKAFGESDYLKARSLLARLRREPLRSCNSAARLSADICAMMWDIAQKVGRKKVNSRKESVAALFYASRATLLKKKGGYFATLTYDFETPQQVGDWTWRKGVVNIPKWSVIEEDGKKALQAKGTGSRMVWCGEFTGDVSAKARLKLKGDGHVVVHLHNNRRECYVFAMNMDQKFFTRPNLPPELSELGPKGVRNLIFMFTNNGVLALDKTSASGSGARLAPKADKWLLLEARRRGKSLRLTLDGKTLVSGSDESNLSGSVKLEVGDARVLWDEITLAGLLDSDWLNGRRAAMVRACIEQGPRAFLKGDFETAFRRFDKLVEILPDCAEAWCWLGISLMGRNLWEEAILAFGIAQKQKKRFFEAQHWEALAYLARGEYEKAAAAFEKSLSVCADNKDGWQKLAECYKGLNRAQEAREALRKAASSEQVSLLPEFVNLPEFVAGQPTHRKGKPGTISGRITDERGKPVAGITVHVCTKTKTLATLKTGKNGRYEATGLPEGKMKVIVWDPAGRKADPRFVEVDVGTAGVDFVLRKGSPERREPRGDHKKRASELAKFAKDNYPGVTKADLKKLEQCLKEAANDPISPEEALKWWESMKASHNKGRVGNLRGMIRTWESWKAGKSFPWHRGGPGHGPRPGPPPR